MAATFGKYRCRRRGGARESTARPESVRGIYNGSLTLTTPSSDGAAARPPHLVEGTTRGIQIRREASVQLRLSRMRPVRWEALEQLFVSPVWRVQWETPKQLLLPSVRVIWREARLQLFLR